MSQPPVKRSTQDLSKYQISKNPYLMSDLNKGSSRRRTTTSTGSSSNTATNVIRFKTSFRNTIFDVMKARGWKESSTSANSDNNDNSNWDFYWADRDVIYEIFDSIHLEAGQKVNHFRNGRELCRKDLLVKNLKRTKREYEKSGNDDVDEEYYNFFPVTYVLPGDYALFVEEFKRHPGSVYIMKPIGKAQGKGIFLFSKLSQISDWRTESRYSNVGNQSQGASSASSPAEAYVVQKYISNPYLIGGKKFDIRLYVLVTSFSSPLQVYLFRNGFARFSNTRYSNDPNDIANSFIHLTNVAIQKTAQNYDKQTGGKWDLRRLKLYLISKHGRERVDRAFRGIQQIIVRSLTSVSKIMIQDKHCFELYGYDVLFDEELKPWLIEVNASPSLSANTASDYQMKAEMLNDMLEVLEVEKKGSTKSSPSTSTSPKTVGGFDLIYQDADIPPTAENSLYSTLLGAEIQRNHHTAFTHKKFQSSKKDKLDQVDRANANLV